MKRGIALMTITALLGTSAPFAYAYAQPSTSSVSNVVGAADSTYIVKSGDTLWKIAQATGASVQSIVQANGVTNLDQIQIGTVLIIPRKNTTYTVKSGDTLWKISQATGTSVQALVQANGLTKPDQLSVGQALIIPSTGKGSTSTAGTTATDTTNATNGVATYTVKSGDTLWKIAQVTSVTVQALVQANGLSNPNSLTVGEVLQLPLATTGTTGSNTGVATGSVTAAVGSVVLTTNGAGAYNTSSTKVNQSVKVSATVKDSQGNTLAVPQNLITYTITGANAASNPANAKIDTSTQGFTATQPGIYSCVATVDGVQSQPLALQVFGNPSTLSISVNHHFVTGSNTWVPVRISVADSIGQPIMWTPMTITVDNLNIAGLSLTNSGPVTKLPATVSTTSGGDGVITVWAKAGTVSGQANIVVTCGGLTQSVPIYSSSGPARITASVAQTTVIANTKFSDLVTVQAFNADGTPAAGIPLSTDYSSLFKVDGSQVTTNSQGVAQFNVYENNSSTGIGTVGARTAGAAADIPVTVVPGADAKQSSVSGLPGTMTLGADYVAPVTVKDASGNPVLHLTQDAFDLQLMDALGVHNVLGDVTEIGNGQYQVTFKPGESGYGDANLSTGNETAALFVNGVQIGPMQNVAVGSGSPTASGNATGASGSTTAANVPHIALSFAQNLVAGGGNSIYPLKIVMTDANGKPMPNQPVILSSNDKNIATPSSAVVTTDNNGVAGVALTPGFMAGTATITAMSGGATQSMGVNTVVHPIY